MPRIFRRDIDSSLLPLPRTFSRVFCEPSALADTVRFYEAVSHQPVDQDIDLSENGMRIVAIGGFLIIVLDEEKVGPTRYEHARKTTVTIVAPHLEIAVNDAIAMGAEQVGERFAAPHASGCRLRHPDGTLVEYLQHRPSPFDAMTPGTFA